MNILGTISRGIDRLCSFLITYLLVWMTLVTAAQIVVRVVFNSGITWAEEMARYSMIWMVFLGSAVAARADSHISVTALEEKFPSIQKWLKPLQHLLSLIYLILVIRVSWSVLSIVKTQTSANMEIPMSVVYISIPISFIIICIHILLKFKKNGTNDKGETMQ